VLFQRLRQPVVLGYISQGSLSPERAHSAHRDSTIIRALSETGVILLMFSLGLEFSLRKLAQVGPSAILTAVIETSIMMWLGYITGLAFGWTQRECIFAGAIIAISSTTIIAKAFDERGIKGRLKDLVVGVLIVEDLIAILLMAFLTALSSGDDISTGTIIGSGGRLAAFLSGLVVAGLLIIPRLVRAIIRLQRAETTLVASIGICFAIALLTREFGYSAALGAFIAGSLVAESGEEKHIEHLVLPVRDMFVAIFFVSVGRRIDPSMIFLHWPEVVVFTLVVVLGKVTGVTLGAFFTGNGIRTSTQTGMSFAQIGEFSFIIAGLGISLHAAGEFLYAIAVAVSALTTLTTPWLIRSGDPVARFIDRKLPKPFQTFAALYGTWIENMTTAPQDKTAGRKVRRLVKLLLLDSVLLTALVIGTAVSMNTISTAVVVNLGIADVVARLIIILISLGLALPFIIGVIRVARGLGLALASLALPVAGKGRSTWRMHPAGICGHAPDGNRTGRGDTAARLAQPFLPGWIAGIDAWRAPGLPVHNAWRNATNLQGHITAGAELV
jgi:CPA2 family monovalent cation:H+ antiporter-2